MNKEDLRIVFMGTPEFAVPSLKMLIEEGYPVCAVVTQPDRPKGRGHKLVPPPVKVLAQEHGITVLQPEKVTKDGFEDLKAQNANLFITAAFGQILTQAVLDLPEHGTINVHGSLLPKYRGSAPIEWAVINGEAEAGVTTMYTVRAIDAGDMLMRDAVEITENMTGGELREKLSEVGAVTLKRTLEALLKGTLEAVPQDEAESTYYPIPDRDLACINWEKSTKEIRNLVRGLNPAPMAYTFTDGQKVKIFEIGFAENMSGAAEPGSILVKDPKKGLIVRTGDGTAEILRLQFPGGKPMSAKDYLRGKGISADAFTKGE